MARMMALGDYFIGKPGPASLTEAVHCGLPVITFGNAWTMPQERYNLQWVRENKVGLVVRSVGSVRSAVEHLLSELDHYKSRVRGLNNRAVFEIPLIFDRILDEAARSVAFELDAGLERVCDDLVDLPFSSAEAVLTKSRP